MEAHMIYGSGSLVVKSCLTLVTPWAIACQAPLFVEFPRQEYCSGLPFPSPVDLPNPETEPVSLVSPALAEGFFTTVPPGRPLFEWWLVIIIMWIQKI